MKRLIAALCLTLSPFVLAQDDAGAIYRWTDKQGQDHYTDDPSAIPQEYRKKAQKTKGRELMEVRSSGGNAGAGSVSSGSAGPDEAVWRERFQQVHAEIARLEAQLAADQELIRSSVPALRGGVPRTSEAVREAQARVTDTEQALQKAREELELLDREASQEAVPREWRRP